MFPNALDHIVVGTGNDICRRPDQSQVKKSGSQKKSQTQGGKISFFQMRKPALPDQQMRQKKSQQNNQRRKSFEQDTGKCRQIKKAVLFPGNLFFSRKQSIHRQYKRRHIGGIGRAEASPEKETVTGEKEPETQHGRLAVKQPLSQRKSPIQSPHGRQSCRDPNSPFAVAEKTYKKRHKPAKKRRSFKSHLPID